ncbi:MAG TPA: hypothetical protein VH500_05880 [Nitrososphaeraceae archaeon]|jgi:hypothetical protein
MRCVFARPSIVGLYIYRTEPVWLNLSALEVDLNNLSTEIKERALVLDVINVCRNISIGVRPFMPSCSLVSGIFLNSIMAFPFHISLDLMQILF